MVKTCCIKCFAGKIINKYLIIIFNKSMPSSGHLIDFNCRGHCDDWILIMNMLIKVN